jgi:hypothetical protein
MHSLLTHGRASAIIFLKNLTALRHDAQSAAHKKDNQPFSSYHTPLVVFLLIFNASLHESLPFLNSAHF